VPTAILAGLLAFYFWGIPIAGVLVAGVWIALVFARTQLATAESANPHAYAEVWSHLQYLAQRLDYQRDATASASGQGSAQAAIESTRAVRKGLNLYGEINSLLSTRGAHWTTGTGYVQIWELAHRVEEALLMADTDESVAARGLYEERRLVGAQIGEVDELLAQVRQAVVTLDPIAAAYLKQMPPAARSASVSNAGPARDHDPPAASPSPGRQP